MIKPSDLRIGNLLSYGAHGPVLVKEIKDTGSIKVHMISEKSRFNGYGKYMMHISQLDPIPLTPEWLERIGGTTPYCDTNIWAIGSFTFYLHQSYGLCQWDAGSYEIINGTIHYKYVHQLQNLIHALTGLELTIKETV